MVVRREVKRRAHPSVGKPTVLWLSRGDSPFCTLTMLPPIIRLVNRTKREEPYCQPGDSVLIRHLCPDMVMEMFGQLPNRRSALRVELTGRVLVEDAGCV